MNIATIIMLLEIYVNNDYSADPESDTCRNSLHTLKDTGLIRTTKSGVHPYEVTQRGQIMVDDIKHLKLPVQQWVSGN